MNDDPHAMRALAADLEADVVIVGAGPAGLAAALAAVQAGASVLVLDAAPAAGGQIWRARQGVAVAVVAHSLAELERSGVRVVAGARVVMPLPQRSLLVDGPQGTQRLHWRCLIIATGARERLLPFPGWTLPGVFGAGGLQALVKGGWPIAGRRVVVAGTGPLLVAAAATLRREGARVVGLIEEAPASALVRFAGALARHPRKGFEALRLARALLGVPVMTGARIVAAEGHGRLERVVAGAGDPSDDAARSDGAARSRAVDRVIDCDVLAAGWGLVPQTELAEALGCPLAPRFGAPAVLVDGDQRTGLEGVFAAGECTGIAGVRAAGLQGAIAGRVAAIEARGPGDRSRGAGGPGSCDAAANGRRPESRSPSCTSAATRRDLAREFGFAAAVAVTFPVPSRWAARLRDDTLVCRCEDVAWSALRECPDLRSAKLATRCGMGHCQGRLCHDALATMMRWPRLQQRPPLMPVALGALAALPPHMPAVADPDNDSLSTKEISP